MMKKLYSGVFSLLSLIAFIVIILAIYAQDIAPSANHLKLAGFALISTVIFSALFAIRSFDPTYNKKSFVFYFFLGALLIVIGALLLFEVLSFSDLWNWYVSGLVIFILLSGLAIMDWSTSKSLLVKISGILLILSAGFITILFITLRTSHLLGVWLDIATYVAFITMAVGIYFSRKKR